MHFYPEKTLGLLIGGAVLVAAAALGAAAVLSLSTQPYAALSVVWLLALVVAAPVFAWAAYRWWGLLTARYTVANDALTVAWGARREVIPLEHIEELHMAGDFPGELKPHGLNWPGCLVSRVMHEQLGAVEFLTTTADKAGMVLLGYPGGWLALSPRDPAAFIASVKERAASPLTLDAPIEVLAQRAIPQSTFPPIAQWPLWNDRAALTLIGAGALGVLALAGYLFAVMGQLPGEIALRFDAQGNPARYGPPAGLLLLPAIGAVAWALNTALGAWLHRREAQRPLAQLLWATTLFVVGLTWAATLGLLTAGG
jgi:hypothetical protein